MEVGIRPASLAQAKPVGERLTWLVEACVRELCGDGHASPLKFEVWDPLQMRAGSR